MHKKASEIKILLEPLNQIHIGTFTADECISHRTVEVIPSQISGENHKHITTTTDLLLNMRAII